MRASSSPTSITCSVPRSGPVTSLSWTTSARTKLPGWARGSSTRPPRYSICPPPRPTSTPSRRPGETSMGNPAQPGQEPQQHSTKPLQNCSQPSDLKTQLPGSDCHSLLYSNSESALEAVLGHQFDNTPPG